MLTLRLLLPPPSQTDTPSLPVGFSCTLLLVGLLAPCLPVALALAALAALPLAALPLAALPLAALLFAVCLVAALFAACWLVAVVFFLASSACLFRALKTSSKLLMRGPVHINQSIIIQ